MYTVGRTEFSEHLLHYRERVHRWNERRCPRQSNTTIAKSRQVQARHAQSDPSQDSWAQEESPHGIRETDFPMMDFVQKLKHIYNFSVKTPYQISFFKFVGLR
ncbi:hypothetical protein AVEN_227684-1 [Araneus ventricosus]|uniref:Uncharacterized protein n=1 Tax=Araneus ventricosus TaxID=182803 RepID=A0A4Y2WKC9_ARAVE|nr:hypothetical protein AVEN_227684-1 [Araneus ventricosus]